MNIERLNLLVAAGGTGGHLFPAMAVVEELKRNLGDRLSVVFVGNAGRIEGKAVPAAGYEFHDMPIRGINSKFSLSNLTLPFKIFKSINICSKLIRHNQINAVLCTGAYISYPAGISASTKGIPLFLMESNVIPGKTIRALSAKSRLIITSFAETENYLTKGSNTEIINLGNPVRLNLLNLPDQSTARVNFGLEPDKKTILVFGGSLGARTINNAIEKFINKGLNSDLQIIWQTGSYFESNIKENKNLRILKFIDDMASAYSAADLVISRSGATTMSELAVTRKPAILVPFPKAANNHQELNADSYDKIGAAVKIRDLQLWDKIEYIIPELLNDAAKLDSMKQNLDKLSKPDAACQSAVEILNRL